MILEDMSARRRREVVMLALGFALQDIDAPVTTTELVGILAARLETDEKRSLARLLMELAPLVPEAIRSGSAFKRYGREMKPWLWGPRKRSNGGPPLTSGSPADPAASDEWTIQPEGD